MADKLDFNRVALLLHVAEGALKFPNLKPILAAATAELNAIAEELNPAPKLQAVEPAKSVSVDASKNARRV